MRACVWSLTAAVAAWGHNKKQSKEDSKRVVYLSLFKRADSGRMQGAEVSRREQRASGNKAIGA